MRNPTPIPLGSGGAVPRPQNPLETTALETTIGEIATSQTMTSETATLETGTRGTMTRETGTRDFVTGETATGKTVRIDFADGGKFRRNLGIKGLAAAVALGVAGLFLGHTLAGWADGALGNELLGSSGQLELRPLSFTEAECLLEAADTDVDPDAACLDTTESPEFKWIAVCDQNSESVHYAPCPPGWGVSELVDDAVTNSHPMTNPQPHVFLEAADAVFLVSPWQVKLSGQNITAVLHERDFMSPEFSATGDALHWAGRVSFFVPASEFIDSGLGGISSLSQEVLLTNNNDGDIYVMVIGYRGLGMPVQNLAHETLVPYDWQRIEDCALIYGFNGSTECPYYIDMSAWQYKQNLEDKVFSLELRPTLEQVRDVTVTDPMLPTLENRP